MADFCEILKTKGFVTENLKGAIPEDSLQKKVAGCSSSHAPATATVTSAISTRRSKATATITTSTFNVVADSNEALEIEVVGEVVGNDEFLEGVGEILVVEKEEAANGEGCEDASGTTGAYESLKSKIFKRSDYLGRSSVGAARKARSDAGLHDKFPLTDPLLQDFSTHEKGSGTALTNIGNMVITF